MRFNKIIFYAFLCFSLSAFSQGKVNKKLEEIVVKSNKKKAEDIDKKVYTPRDLLSSQNASAKELIQNLPSVNMDNENGNVSLRGDENVTIMINGKITSLSGESINQIPASAIERIEVISVPNAKYNSDGSAGVINIVLKKADETYNGGFVSGSAGWNNKYNVQTGYNFNVGKFAFNTALSYSYKEYKHWSESNRLYLDNADKYKYDHSGTGENIDRLYNGRLGIDYAIDTQNSLSFVGSLTMGWNSDYSHDHDTFGDSTLKPYSQWYFDNTETDKSILYNVDVNYTFLSKQKNKWTVDFSIGDVLNDKANNYRQIYDLLNGQASNYYYPYKVNQGQKRNIMALQTDYNMKVAKNHILETGLRIGQRNYHYSTTYLEGQNYETQVDTWSNDFRYLEYVFSLYGMMSSQWSDHWSTKFGVRLEQTNTRSTNYDTTELYKYDYFNAFPSATISYDIGEKKGTVSTSYSFRMNRPEPGQLNPLQYVGDPVSKLFGNPFLKPETIHSMELGYENKWKKWNLSTNVYYKQSNNTRTRYLTPQTDGTFLVKVENLGKLNFVGWEAIAFFNIGKSMKLSLNSNLSYNNLYYAIDSIEYRNNYVNWQGRGLYSIKFSHGWETQLIAFYKSPFKTAQGNIHFVSNVDFTIRKKVFKQKGTLIFSVFDIFNDKKFEINASDETFRSHFYRKRESRYAEISFRYSFGKPREIKSNKINDL